MNRRKYVLAIGGTVVIAGCSGESDDELTQEEVPEQEVQEDEEQEEQEVQEDEEQEEQAQETTTKGEIEELFNITNWLISSEENARAEITDQLSDISGKIEEMNNSIGDVTEGDFEEVEESISILFEYLDSYLPYYIRDYDATSQEEGWPDQQTRGREQRQKQSEAVLEKLDFGDQEAAEEDFSAYRDLLPNVVFNKHFGISDFSDIYLPRVGVEINWGVSRTQYFYALPLNMLGDGNGRATSIWHQPEDEIISNVKKVTLNSAAGAITPEYEDFELDIREREDVKIIQDITSSLTPEEQIFWVSDAYEAFDLSNGYPDSLAKYSSDTTTGVLLAFESVDDASRAYDSLLTDAYSDGTTGSIGGSQTVFSGVEKLSKSEGSGAIYFYGVLINRYIVILNPRTSQWKNHSKVNGTWISGEW